MSTAEHSRTYLSPAQVADRLGVSVATVRRHIYNGTLPAYQLGKRGAVRLDWDEVRQWMRGEPEHA